jgi:hypothetical protein
MNRRRKIAVAIVVVAMVFIAATGGYVHYLMQFGAEAAHEIVQAQMRLLCETDHQALLDACRELSCRYLNGELDGNEPLESSPQLPEVIRALRPKHVSIGRDGLVVLEMGFGMWPLGVQAYPEGYPKYPPPFKYGDRELLQGLWYYEDGYSTHPEAYDKRTDELLSKNKMLQRAVPESETRSK